MNVFLTFGAGDAKFISASERLAYQACRTGIFHKIVKYNSEHLKEDKNFWNQHGEFIKANSRMYGYGIWKPYLVMNELKKLKDGDVLFYADSGCEFDLDCENPKENYELVVEKMKQSKVFINSTNCNHDKQMNKKDLVAYLDMVDSPESITQQIQATSFLIVKNIETMKFVEKWYTICCNYHFIDDTPSLLKNEEDFNEHRHDQSVFSLLMKKMGLGNFPILNHFTVDYIICLSRNRSGNNFPACRVTGSSFYDINNGNDYIEGNQIIHMSKLFRRFQPQYILETGFGYGRTACVAVQSCRNYPIVNYIICDVQYDNSGYKPFFNAMCPYIHFIESRTQDLFRESFFTTRFPHGIDWVTIDGDSSYQGVIFDIISVIPHVNAGGVIYIVANRLNKHDVKEATDFISSIFSRKGILYIDQIPNVNKEVAYFVLN